MLMYVVNITHFFVEIEMFKFSWLYGFIMLLHVFYKILLFKKFDQSSADCDLKKNAQTETEKMLKWSEPFSFQVKKGNVIKNQSNLESNFFFISILSLSFRHFVRRLMNQTFICK